MRSRRVCIYTTKTPLLKPDVLPFAPPAKTWALRFFTASPWEFSWRTRRLDRVLHGRELPEGLPFSSRLCTSAARRNHPPSQKGNLLPDNLSLHQSAALSTTADLEAAPERNTKLAIKLLQISWISRHGNGRCRSEAVQLAWPCCCMVLMSYVKEMRNNGFGVCSYVAILR